MGANLAKVDIQCLSVRNRCVELKYQLTSSWMLRRLCTITQSGKAPIVTAADKKASYRDCGNVFRFSCSLLSPMRGSARWHVPRMNIPHQWLLPPESSTARPFAVDLFKDRDQPGSCVAALLKIAPVVNRISRRAIDFRPVQEAESRRVSVYPSSRTSIPIFTRIDISGLSGGFLMDEN